MSNPVILPGLLDLPMDFESFAEAGTGLGSGGFLVYDSSRCIVRVVAGFAQFLARRVLRPVPRVQARHHGDRAAPDRDRPGRRHARGPRPPPPADADGH